jgi:putative MATE family efflux protein
MEKKLFDTDHLVKTYFTQAIPLVLSMTVTMIYNIADTYFIAQTENTLLVAGVSLCAPIFTLLMAFGNIYAQGGSSLVSRLLGMSDKESVKRVSSFCFYLAIFTGIAVGLVMILFRQPLLHLLGADQDTITYASEYYTVLGIGAPVIVVNFVHANLLRSEGKATQSMIGTIGGALINIILDPIFISVLGMGAFGAALATVIGYISSVLYFLIVVLKDHGNLSVNFASQKVSLREFRQILAVGITAAITNIASSIIIVVMNQYLLPLGAEKIASLGIVLKVTTVSSLILVGFSFGGVPMFGFLYGARDFTSFKKLLRFCTLFVSGLAFAISVVVMAAATPLIRIFMADPAIVRDGSLMLRWQIAGLTFGGIVLLYTCLFQAIGKALPALVLSLSRQGLIFLAVFGVLILLAGYQGFLAAQVVSDLVSGLLALTLYSRVRKKELTD